MIKIWGTSPSWCKSWRMRKRKFNPSQGEVGLPEDHGLQPEVGSVSNPREVVTPRSQPTVSVIAQGVPASRHPGKGSDVATEEEPSPPGTGGSRPKTIPAGTAEATPVEAETTGSHIVPSTEQVLVDRLGEEEADVAGSLTANPYWCWELLAEAGYDVW